MDRHALALAGLQPVSLPDPRPLGDDPILVTGGATDSAVAMGHALDAITAQIEAHRRRPIVLSMGHDPGWPTSTRPRASSCATPHGTAAARTDEERHHDKIDGNGDLYDGGKRWLAKLDARAARKVSNARKAKRGWR